jgi:hypothetical protein
MAFEPYYALPQHDLADEFRALAEMACAPLGGIEIAGQQQREEFANADALESGYDERGCQLAALAERRIGANQMGRPFQFGCLHGQEIEHFTLSRAVIDNVAGIDAIAALP